MGFFLKRKKTQEEIEKEREEEILKKKNKVLEDFLKSDGDIFYSKKYRLLSQTPEVIQCVNKIADLISGMTIKLYRNSELGDIRVVNELSKKIDINPNSKMTRKSFIFCIVRDLILRGNSYALPIYKNGYLEDIEIFKNSDVTQEGYLYKYKNSVFGYDEILHFLIHPKEDDFSKGEGLKIYLQDVVNSLAQANTTKQNFMENQFQPSIIIKVDSTEDVLTTPEGQRKLHEKYLKSVKNGLPFFIPTDLFQVETVKPLTLNDIAIIDGMKLDKATIGNFLGVPLFMLGIGEYNQDEYNQFINGVVRSVSQAIEQELTKKILSSSDMYFKFNKWSLYQYDIFKLASTGKELFSSGLMLGNEVRNWLDLPPDENLNEFQILENYIPLKDIGNQKKLKGGENDEQTK